MTSIIINGGCGKMGRVLFDVISSRDDCAVNGIVDVKDGFIGNVKVQNSFEGLNADVVIDFSNPVALTSILEFCVFKKIPLVLATTGYGAEDAKNIKSAAERIPVFRSSNMSKGVIATVKLATYASSLLGDGYDIEIIEKHHNQKLDAPSGTALMIADALNAQNGGRYEYVYSRHNVKQKRKPNEIGFHSVRGGSVSGEHQVIFAGDDEIITVTHTALSRKIFAVGALEAAIFIKSQDAGLYDMNSLIDKNNRGGQL